MMKHIKHPVPHKHQTTDYTCGPVCLEMLLDFYNIPYDSAEIEKLCEARPNIGTDNSRLVRAVCSLGETVVTKENASMNDIITTLHAGHPVLVNYFNVRSGVGHFGIVKGMDDEHIILADPKNGDDYSIAIDDFKTVWHDHNKIQKSWMMYIDR